MIVQITNAGAAAITAAAGPIQLSTFQVGSDYNYVPIPADVGIHGTELFNGAPTPYGVVNANVVKYSVILDATVGDFAFGELGLYMANGELFALATSQTLIQKLVTTSSQTGNSIRIDVYLSIVGQNYDMWFDIAESNNPFRVAVLESVDVMPPPQDAVPNVYIVSPASSDQSSFQAYTDRSGLWNFDCYQFANQGSVTIQSFTSTSVTIPLSQFVSNMNPAYFGQVILEFSSGNLFGICRNILAVVVGASTVTLSFQTPVALTPAAGDTALLFSRQALSTTVVNLPIASATTLGAIKVGTTLTINATTGVLDINPAGFPVTSVNGQTGVVVLNASDIQGFAAVAYSGNYSDLIGAPGVYTLPTATTARLGGVKAPQSNNLSVAGDGTIDLTFPPVKTVNSAAPDANGNVVVTVPLPVGLITPTALTANQDLNTIQTTGLYFALAAVATTLVNGPGTAASRLPGVLEVIPFTTTASGGDVIQRWNDQTNLYYRRLNSATGVWTSWIAGSGGGAQTVATTTILGSVIVGTGLNVTPSGVLTTQIQTINGKNDQFLTLTAADVSAVSTLTINQQGGVPGLSTTPNDPALDSDTYTYGRIPFNTIPLGTWWNAGTWNATTNHVAQTGATDLTVFDTSTSLVSGGLQVIDISYNGAVSASATPDYQSVSAEGMVYEVTVAGTTNLDGYTAWNVGDLAVCVNGKWKQVIINFTNVVFSAGTF